MVWVTTKIERKCIKRYDACVVDCFPGMDATERLMPGDLQWTVTIAREEPEPERPPIWPPSVDWQREETELWWIQVAGVMFVVAVAAVLMLAVVFPK
jgi:hypothetical protein